MKYSNLTLGQIEAGINKLGGHEAFLDLLADRVEAAVHIVKTSDEPYVLDRSRWKIESHMPMGDVKLTRHGGDLYIDDKRVDFYSSTKEKHELTSGKDMLKELKGKPILNANVLDYLLKHRELIPDSWARDSSGHLRFFYPCFVGTVYSDSQGKFVRDLAWHGGWQWGIRRVNQMWGIEYPAPLLAS